MEIGDRVLVWSVGVHYYVTNEWKTDVDGNKIEKIRIMSNQNIDPLETFTGFILRNNT